MKVQTLTTKTITLTKEEVLEVLISHLTDEGILGEDYVISEDSLPETISVKLVRDAIGIDSTVLVSDECSDIKHPDSSLFTIDKQINEHSSKSLTQSGEKQAKSDIKLPNEHESLVVMEAKLSPNKTRIYDPFSDIDAYSSLKTSPIDKLSTDISSPQSSSPKKMTQNLFA